MVGGILMLIFRDFFRCQLCPFQLDFWQNVKITNSIENGMKTKIHSRVHIVSWVDDKKNNQRTIRKLSNKSIRLLFAIYSWLSPCIKYSPHIIQTILFLSINTLWHYNLDAQLQFNSTRLDLARFDRNLLTNEQKIELTISS